MLSIPPSDLCTDQEFVRRAYLDVCGILPTPDEVRGVPRRQGAGQAGQADRRAAGAAGVRRLLDAEMVGRAPQQPQDDPGQGRRTSSSTGCASHIASNTPASTRWSRELLTANGSTFANPPANYYRIARDPQNLAETTAQLFFGIRMQCAKCHNHPFERWTQDDYYSMAAFFARVQQKKDPLRAGRQPADARRRDHLQRPRRRGDAAAHRQGDAAEVPGRRRRRHRRRARTAARCWPTWLTSRRQPVLRQVGRQPHLVSTSSARASSIRWTTSATRTRRPTTNCSTPWPRTSSPTSST